MNINTPLNIKNQQSLMFHFLDNGLIKCIDANSIRISLKPASLFSKAGANLYLRKKEAKGYIYTALLGPASNSTFGVENNQFFAEGCWEGIHYKCVLQLLQQSTSWQWSVETQNTTDKKVKLDIIYVQDVGLKPISDALVNEYYVSQYLERRILKDVQYGHVVCCRQNFKDGTETPWLQLICKNKAVSASTDGIQFYGKSFRETGVPEGLLQNELGGECSAELSIVAIQETPFILAPNASYSSIFIGAYTNNHPEATSDKDLQNIPQLVDEFQEVLLEKTPEILFKPQANKFNAAVFLPSEDLNTNEVNRYFGSDKRHVEEKDEQLLSFFNKENNHVVLKAKELLVDRPHGHIMQAKAGYTPDENIMSTTAYACGIFNSHITQGNTNFNRFLSLSTSQFNLEAETGQRIFVKVGGQSYLLGLPSAFEMGLNHCRWIYKFQNRCFQIRSWTSKTTPQVNMDFKVLQGESIDLLVTNHFDEALNWKVTQKNTHEFIAKPKEDSLMAGKFSNAQFRICVQSGGVNHKVHGNEILYFDRNSHGGSFLNFEVQNAFNFCISFLGEVVTPSKFVRFESADRQWATDCNDAQNDWQNLSSKLSLKSNHADVSVIQDVLPWYGVNALTHLLTPHGLEQFDGAAWGTRDTTQGPFELLLCTEKFEESKEILRIIFSHQSTDGGWPQWWMFDSYSEIRAGGSHGDIHHWCIIALANYIKATGDVGFLSEILPYYYEKGRETAEKTSLLEHTERLIDMLIDSFIPNTALVPFGGGDWNDSMQPASKALAERLVSSWTVALNYQAFTGFQKVYELLGEITKANRLKSISQQIKADFNKHLIKDNIVAGHGLLEADNSFSLLLHPTDTRTNIQYRLLPMIRGVISGIFTKEQAEFHQQLIEQHLKGPDGARLMNRPPKYHGGIQTIFQRAESSCFFGREIGIMYMHAHLRYAETQARLGNAEAFVKALRQANPIAYKQVVDCGDVRQANCYYSSSDVTFGNRYEADERYEELKSGKITLKGGWRIYSSGPGIYMGLVVWHLLGLRTEFGKTIIDPVVPKSLDGLSASIEYKGFPLTLNFSVNKEEYHPKAIVANGQSFNYKYEDNPYRKGGAVIDTQEFLNVLNKKYNQINIQL
ncbi:GH36-type glycosyl hydrolase domain-containing protein [Snuella lapsa]|uniref:Cellobiose phosphorylase n=1 Tax=Snuella lapsa TaxID=870481 RepID=A0ABP6X6R2_9FLAO